MPYTVLFSGAVLQGGISWHQIEMEMERKTANSNSKPKPSGAISNGITKHNIGKKMEDFLKRNYLDYFL
jgi:hypothetical protein